MEAGIGSKLNANVGAYWGCRDIRAVGKDLSYSCGKVLRIDRHNQYGFSNYPRDHQFDLVLS